MKLCWSKECCIVFTYLVNFCWRLFTPLTDTVNLSCCGPPCGREQVLLITACVAGGFLVCVFLTLTLRTLTATRKLNRGRNRKRWRRGRGEKAVRKTACNQPLEIFETAFAFWRQGAAVLPTEFQPVSWCQIPSGYKLQKSTVGWNAAYLIYVRSKKYSTSVFETSRKSSAVLKLQRIILKSKRGAVSERKIFLKKEKTYVAHLLAKTTHCVAWYRERFVFAQPDSSQEFSDAKKFYASKTPNNLKRIILKRKCAVSEWEIF